MTNTEREQFLQWVQKRNPNQPEFVQAVEEVYEDLFPLLEEYPQYQQEKILQRLTEPDRIISFRVCWEDDSGAIQINRGYRVQHCGAIGSYKGGIRFHPSVNESILKFLAFEQTFKNALTGLPIGSGKGGADFSPKGRSDREIMRFCQAFMNELYRHIGENTDVPAGDINVGQREIGYLFGQYRRLANNFSGTLTGKDIDFGGSHVRLETTGFGLVYFLEEMLKTTDDHLEDKIIAISGAGNVALHAALKATQKNARVITLSNSSGTLLVEEGFDEDTLRELLKTSGKPDLEQLAENLNGTWQAEQKPWALSCDIALPCATQNELDVNDARQLADNGCKWLAEGANMPCTEEAINILEKAGIPNAPGKASNAGGVALSGMEMSQNASFTTLPYDQLDQKLQEIMHNIHEQCVKNDENNQQEKMNYRRGANIAAFKRIASALSSQGIG